MAKPVWRDTTSYSQFEKHPRTPRSWAIGEHPYRVSVYRMNRLGGWFMTCHQLGLNQTQLHSECLDDAKAEALERVGAMLAAITEAFAAIGAVTPPKRKEK